MRPFLKLTGLFQGFSKAKSVFESISFQITQTFGLHNYGNRQFMFMAIALLLFPALAVAEYEPIDYDALPNMNSGVDFFVPQVDWFWLFILMFTCIVALRIWYAVFGFSGLGGGNYNGGNFNGGGY